MITIQVTREELEILRIACGHMQDVVGDLDESFCVLWEKLSSAKQTAVECTLVWHRIAALRSIRTGGSVDYVWCSDCGALSEVCLGNARTETPVAYKVLATIEGSTPK